MKPITRIITALAALAMIASFFLPLWQIQLWAPQYPEGLNMKIWHNHLSGAFDIINGLNHYIGMHLIKEEMFPEFSYIGILIGIYIAIGLLAAITGKKVLLRVFVITGIVYGIAALYDFYRWGYDYGHNLDPSAAIRVPGMSYQPPVIGYKNLLNFTAYSGPDQGGWVIIGSSVVAMLLLAYEYFVNRKSILKVKGAQRSVVAVVALLMLTVSCSPSGPAPIRYGKDECKHCKMTLTDQRFGAEIISSTGIVLKFDDMNCLVNYLNENSATSDKTKGIYVVDFSRAGEFIEVEKAMYVHSDELNSPMGGEVAAFSNKTSFDAVYKQLTTAESLTWDKVKNLY